ncbi:MAG: hypothetical protein AABX91_02025 [Nanoarchaeota archaeon]
MATYRKKRYLITSAQAAASPYANLLDGFQRYSKDNKAEIIVLPMIGNSAKEDVDKLHRLFKDHYDIEEGKRKLNNNIQVEQFNVRPYQIDPLVGLNRFAQRETTLVFASPKQRLKPVAHSNHKYPKFLVTTGACTWPNYATGMDQSAERRRLGNIAKRDHVYGGLIVEVEGAEIFHMRHIRADTDGKFVDLGVKYDGKKVSSARLEAMVLGDYHHGVNLDDVREATYEMIAEFEPKKLFLHDFMDGHSVSHHVDKRFIEVKLIQQMDKGHHILERELREGYDELMFLNKLMKGKPIYLVASNHDEFLNRYLNEGRFMWDPPNARYAFELAGYMAAKDYNNPMEAGFRKIGKVPDNIIFLRRDEDLKIRGFQLGAHGDKGPGDGRGSITTKENDWGKSISGHCHKAQILRNTYTVGTMLPLTPYYMRGWPSDSSHTHGLLWDTGTVQLVNIIDGKYRL